MVRRDPSIVSPSLTLHTGVFIGGGITNTVQDRGARCQSSVVPPLPDGDGGVTDRATRKRASQNQFLSLLPLTFLLPIRTEKETAKRKRGASAGPSSGGRSERRDSVSANEVFLVGSTARIARSIDTRHARPPLAAAARAAGSRQGTRAAFFKLKPHSTQHKDSALQPSERT